MPMQTLRTAVAEYDDGSEGVIEVRKLTPHKGEAFMTIASNMGNDSIVIGTLEQAHQLATAIRSAAKEIWEA